jgi:hypothetical protein
MSRNQVILAHCAGFALLLALGGPCRAGAFSSDDIDLDALLLTDGITAPDDPAAPPAGSGPPPTAADASPGAIVGSRAQAGASCGERSALRGKDRWAEDAEGDPAGVGEEGDPTASYVDCPESNFPAKKWKAKLCKPIVYPGNNPPIYCLTRAKCWLVPICGQLTCTGIFGPGKVQISITKCCSPKCISFVNVCVGKCCKFSCLTKLRVPWCGNGKITITPIKSCGKLCCNPCHIITIPVNVK